MGVPSGDVKGTMEVAVDTVMFFPALVERSSWRKERKFGVSWSDMMLHPEPCLFGYSQLKAR